jgi:hypothetical protein
MTWRAAKSLDVLLKQVNAKWPGRDKSSDGTIGDEAHSARTSDHNPNDAGVVCARDITHDPAHGLDARKLAETLVASRDERIKYVISNAQICSGAGQNQPAWKWRPYSGINAHRHHVHISVKGDPAHYDNTAPWGLGDSSAAQPAPPAVSQPPKPTALPVLRKGSKGVAVQTLQGRLNAHGAKLTISGQFDDITDAAVRAFQTKAGLTDDGVVGDLTWAALK